MDRVITVLKEQTIWDIAVQEYGSAEGVFQLMEDNPEVTGLDAVLTVGQLLKIKTAPLEQSILNFYQDNDLHPVTGALLRFGGDFNDDFNDDFNIQIA